MVAQFLDIKKAPYEFVSIDDNPELRQQLIEKTSAMTVPLTFNSHGDFVVGYNLSRLSALVDKERGL